MDFYQPQEQVGFRTEFGTNDHLTMIEKASNTIDQ